MTTDDLARRVGHSLVQRGLSLATSESLTGGLIGAVLTSIPGSSAFYLGGVIAYATGMKSRISGVDPRVLSTYGVVSEQTVTEMALGIVEVLEGNWNFYGDNSVQWRDVTITVRDTGIGIAPGVVWICVAGPTVGQGVAPLQAHRYVFEGDRGAVREQTVAASLELLLRMMSPV